MLLSSHRDTEAGVHVAQCSPSRTHIVHIHMNTMPPLWHKSENASISFWARAARTQTTTKDQINYRSYD